MNQDKDIETFVSDLIDLAGNPAVSFLGSQVSGAIRRERLRVAAETLTRRMRRGKPWLFRESEVAALVFDFLRAAEDGTAKRNIEIMADLIANGVGEEGLTEEAVRHLMRTIAALSYEELRVIAAMIRAIHGLGPPEEGGPPDVFKQVSEVWNATWRQFAGAGEDRPSNEMYARVGALQRTGFIVAHSGMGALAYGPSPSLMRLNTLTDLSEDP